MTFILVDTLIGERLLNIDHIIYAKPDHDPIKPDRDPTTYVTMSNRDVYLIKMPFQKFLGYLEDIPNLAIIETSF